MFEDIQQHRAAVAENIQKAMEIGFTGNELEKAHKVGDVHPNGKWVWTQLPSGKYDWRVIKKTGAGSGGSAPSTTQKTAQSGKKELEADYDVAEYNRQRGLVEKVSDEGLSFGLNIVKNNLSKKEKELSETQSQRPGAKVTIAKLKNEVKFFKGQEKAISEEIKSREEARSTGGKKEKGSKKISLNGKTYYIWKEGKDFRGSFQNPSERITDVNSIAKFNSSQGFESISDVEEYAKKYIH